MYNIVIEDRILEKIRTYVDLLLDGYLLRFSDTGMGEAESIIQDNYIQSAELLADSIYDAIVAVMPHEIVAYSVDGLLRNTSTRMGSRSISISYREDTLSRTRYISDIDIIRR